MVQYARWAGDDAATRRRGSTVAASCALALTALGFAVVTAQDARLATPPPTLERAFRDPPAGARPHVYWHWMGPNFSKEGITRDLETMAAAGIGGATIFNLTSAVQESHAPTTNTRWPDHTYRGPAYWDAVRHAASEGARLGVEIGLHNTAGYSTTGGPWIDEPRSMQRLVWSETVVESPVAATLVLPRPAIPPFEGWGKTGRTLSYYRDIAVLAVPADRPGLQHGDVVDVTTAMTETGSLRWTPRPGRWVVYRLGHASTGSAPHPVPDDVLGNAFEADKLSLDQTRFHWGAVLDPVRTQLAPWIGKSFTHVLIDSYEAGSQNWTLGFREEFIRRKGYDPVPWLVTMGPTAMRDGKATPRRTLGSADQTARFDWDYRDVIAALFQERGWEPAAALVHESGLELAFEPYSGPFDTVAATPVADRPMLEFWTHNVDTSASPVTAAARTAGRRVVSAEAFTSAPMFSAWTETPASLKASGDAAFASGVNRMVLHHWVHQPFDDRYVPGMGMGWWGTHFSGHQTWATPGREFFRYLARVQALLQRGETPIDVVSVGFDGRADSDAISPRALLEDVRVRDGRISLPSGRTYALLHVPHDGALEPDVARRIESLLADGASVVSPRPDRSPSLSDYPRCDAVVRALADSVWGAAERDARHRVLRGRLFTDLDAAKQAIGWSPVARIEGPGAHTVRVHARRDGAVSIFFVTNLDANAARVTASFRVADLQPELWNAETGAITTAAVWRRRENRTEVDLHLPAATSTFVVFRTPAPARAIHVTAVDAPCAWTVGPNPAGAASIQSSAACAGRATLSSGAVVDFDLGSPTVRELRGPWGVALSPAAGAPTRLTLERLASLAESADASARYFSGTATYRLTAPVDGASLSDGRRVLLDLGAVHDLLRVTVNGRDLGVLWHAPFLLDVTPALRPGDNTFELAVTNTWHNRLVGDEQFPPDCEWGPSRAWAGAWPSPEFKGRDVGRPLKTYPAWFLENTARPSAGRVTFVTWSYHTKDTPLLPAGLVGPVRLVSQPTTVVAE